MGHRSRQITRLLNNDNVSDLDLIEILLFFAIPRKDTREIAVSLKHNTNGLIDLFSNIDKQATTTNIKSIFKLVYEITVRIQKERIIQQYITENYDDLLGYLKIILGEKRQEEFWGVFLNNKEQIIKIELLFSGSYKRVHVCQNEIFKRCILYGLYKIILVHNHPSKDPTPSTQDIQLTNNIIRGANLLEIVVIDHLVIGGNDYFSFKQNGLLN